MAKSKAFGIVGSHKPMVKSGCEVDFGAFQSGAPRRLWLCVWYESLSKYITAVCVKC